MFVTYRLEWLLILVITPAMVGFVLTQLYQDIAAWLSALVINTFGGYAIFMYLQMMFKSFERDNPMPQVAPKTPVPDLNIPQSKAGYTLQAARLKIDSEKIFCHQLVEMSRVNGWKAVDLTEQYWLVDKVEDQSHWVRICSGVSPRDFREMIERMVADGWLAKVNPGARNSPKKVIDPASIRRRAYQ